MPHREQVILKHITNKEKYIQNIFHQLQYTLQDTLQYIPINIVQMEIDFNHKKYNYQKFLHKTHMDNHINYKSSYHHSVPLRHRKKLDNHEYIDAPQLCNYTPLNKLYISLNRLLDQSLHMFHKFHHIQYRVQDLYFHLKCNQLHKNLSKSLKKYHKFKGSQVQVHPNMRYRKIYQYSLHKSCKDNHIPTLLLINYHFLSIHNSNNLSSHLHKLANKIYSHS